MEKGESFKAGVIQFDVKPGDIPSNMSSAFEGLRQLGALAVDLAVLPEMWSCGFDNQRLFDHARQTPVVLDRLSQVAAEYRMIIAGSLPEASGEDMFNTLYLMDGSGFLAGAYRKIHLFSLTDEGRFFAAGETAVVCPTRIGPVGLMTCYDVRFPELCRSLALKGARVVVVPAQWPRVRINHWDVLLQARAIENQIFVVAANRCGKDNGLVYGGHSQIVTPMGNVSVLADDSDAVLHAAIDFQELSTFRDKIPCLAERVPDAYIV
jgi:omega-amidase